MKSIKKWLGTFAVLGISAFILAGCGGSSGGGSTPPPAAAANKLKVSITNSCGLTGTDGTTKISWKIYDENTSNVWPSSTSHYYTSSGDTSTHTIDCTKNDFMCVGATQVTSLGTLDWGVDMYNGHYPGSVDNILCKTCSGATTVSVNLTCN